MNAYELPTTLTVGGVEYDIRTDFRAVLDVLKYASDPEYEDDEKAVIMLRIIFVEWEKIPPCYIQEALQAAVDFIDTGIAKDDIGAPALMDWEQDAPIIIPAINKTIGCEIRSLPYFHWWSFLGAYMETSSESLYSEVIRVRRKRVMGKSLEKYEKDFYKANKSLVDLKRKETPEERAEKDKLLKILDGR